MRSPTSIDCSSFVKGCRQSDGSYASNPGGTGDLGGTYTATIITRWARLLSGLPAVTETAGFTPLVDAKDLTGWEGDKELWSVRDGVLIGHSPGIKHNEFLATTRPYGDFVLSLNFRMIDGKGNSGVQFRSIRVPNREMSGYQADIGEGFWGCLYDESRRNKVLVPASANALKALNKTDWNHYTVRAMGDQITCHAGRSRLGELHRGRARRQGRALGADCGADSCRRSHGSAVQGRDDPAASHADGRSTRMSRGFICERSRPTRVRGNTPCTCRPATTARGFFR